MIEERAPQARDRALADELRAAREEGSMVLPCGRRSRIARHAPASGPDHWLSLTGRARILRLDVEDQTCEVEAGCSPRALAEELRVHGLELGVDAPNASEGTLGGLFLAPDLSLLHAAWGPPHDQVLGGCWMLADGTVVTTGSRVVKSVAGYDVTRLFLGSAGRLAACLRLVLRLRPQPRRRRCFQVERPEAWLGLPVATRPPYRRAFRTPDANWWVETDGIEAPDPSGASAVDPEQLDTARHRALAAFAAAPQRLALHPGDRAHLWSWTGAPAADAGGGRLAWSPELEARVGPTEAAVLRRGHRVPERRTSPWLRRLQEACAPAAPAFGDAPAPSPGEVP